MVAPAKLDQVRYSGFLVWSIIGGLLLLVAAGYAFGQIAGALTPFFIALVLTFILKGPVDLLETKRVPRGWGAVLVFLGFVAIWVLASMLLFPPLAHQISGLVDAFPTYVKEATAFLTDLGTRYEQLHLSDSTKSIIENAGKEIYNWATSVAASSGSAIVAGASGAVGFVFDLVMSFVLTVWFLKDIHLVLGELRVLAGEKWGGDLAVFSTTVSKVLGGYLRGTLIASACTGFLAFVGYQIIGVPYALVLGLLTGLLNVIPMVGPWIGGGVAAVVGLFVSPLTALLSLVVTIAAQQVTDLFISPRVMSSQVELHPIMVIFALLVGGSLLGVVGMIIAVPVVATIKGVFVYYFERRTKRKLASEDGVLFAGTAGKDLTVCENKETGK